MNLKKCFAAVLTGVMVAASVVIPSSADSTATIQLLPDTTGGSYKMNFVSTINTAEVNIVMGNNLQVSSTMTEGANVTLTSGGSTYQAKIDESYLNYNTELTSTYVNVSIADSANTIHQGKYQGFVWSGVLEFTDKTLDPVNDMGFSPTDFTILNAALQIPYEGVGGTVPVTFSRFTGTVKTDSTVKTFPNNATISFHTSANGGKGLTLEQKNQIKSATKIQVIATLKNGYTSSNGVCTLTTDISDAGPAATVSRGTSSVTFDVPKELFYDSKYDETATSIKLYLYGASLSAPEFTSVNIILTLGTPTTTTTATTTPAPVSSTAATTTPAPAADGTDVADTELVLNYTTLTLNKGSSIYLKANYDNVKWTKSGAAIKLYTSGKVTGAAVGTATVYATNAAGEKVACKVNVIESKVPATAIALKTTSGTVYVDSSYNLNSYTITPSSSDDAKNLTWSTSDPSVATVDSNGKVKVVGLGKATITVTTPSGKTSAAVLTAKNPSLTLKTASGTVSAGKQLQISSTAAPSSSKVTYESQDETIATVNATGVITGVKAGSTQIQVTSSKGIVKVFNVTVK